MCNVKFGNPLPAAVSLALNYPPHIICQFLYAREKGSEQGLILRGIKCQTTPTSHVRKKKTTPRLVITIFKCTSSHTLLNGCLSRDLFILICRHNGHKYYSLVIDRSLVSYKKIISSEMAGNISYHHHHHHHHHVAPPARISLTVSRHLSLSFIASGRSSGLHPVSSHSCCM